MTRQQATAALRAAYAELTGLGAKMPSLDHWDGMDEWPANAIASAVESLPLGTVRPDQLARLRQMAVTAKKMILHVAAIRRGTCSREALDRRLVWAWQGGEKLVTLALWWRRGLVEPAASTRKRATQILEDAA